MSIDYQFTRYLAAKKTVDDRALNQQVWQQLMAAIPPAAAVSPWRILEVGAGIGTMVERIASQRPLAALHYTAIDAQPQNIQVAQQRLGHLLPAITLELEAVDLFDFIPRVQGQQTWDLLIAHAFLDLMDMPTLLPSLVSLLRPGGLFYFTINFDGVTILEPSIDPAFDALVLALYHQTMDERLVNGRLSGDSQTGRHLFHHLRAIQAQILAVGSSDWVVFARSDGYVADEAYFLHFIIHTLHQALSGHPQLDRRRFDAWIDQRHAQIEAGDLVYLAHQLDFLGRSAPLSTDGSP